MTADQFMSGAAKAPVIMSLDPESFGTIKVNPHAKKEASPTKGAGRSDRKKSKTSGGKTSPKPADKKTAHELSKEVNNLFEFCNLIINVFYSCMWLTNAFAL